MPESISQLKRECVAVVNDLLLSLSSNPSSHDIRSFGDITPDVYTLLYERLLGQVPPDLVSYPITREDHIHNTQALIDSLSCDVLSIDLSHISGEAVVDGGVQATSNLLEILKGLMEFLSEKVSFLPNPSDQSHLSQITNNESCQIEDPDIISGRGLDIISRVIDEELVNEKGNAPVKQSTKKNIHVEPKKFGGLPAKSSLKKTDYDLSKHVISEPDNAPSTSWQNGERLRMKGDRLPVWSDESSPSATGLVAESLRIQRQIDEEIQKCAAKSKLLAEKSRETSLLQLHSDDPSDIHTEEELGSISNNIRVDIALKKDHEKNIMETLNDLPSQHNKPKLRTSTTKPTGTKPSDVFDRLSRDIDKPARLQSQIEEYLFRKDKRAWTDEEETSETPLEPTVSHGVKNGSQSKVTNRFDEELNSHSRQCSRDHQLDRELDRLEKDELETGKVLTSNVRRERTSATDHSQASLMEQSIETDEEYEEVKKRLLDRLKEFRLTDQSPYGEDVTNIDDVMAKKATGRWATVHERIEAEILENKEKKRNLEKNLAKTLHKVKIVEEQHVSGEKLLERTTRKEGAGTLNVPRLKNISSPRGKYKAPLDPHNKAVKRSSRSLSPPIHTMPSESSTSPSKEPISARLDSAWAKSPRQIEEDQMLPFLLGEFPFIHLSQETASKMWRRQMKQINFLGADKKSSRAKTPTQMQVEGAEQRQKVLMNIMRKEMEHNLRLKERQEAERRSLEIKSRTRDQKLASARVRRYYDDFHTRMKSRMLKARSKEEQIFRDLFDEGLEIQKHRIQEMRKYAREKKKERLERQNNEVDSLENYYRDQFAMLAEAVKQERADLEVRDRAQSSAAGRMQQELRRRLEADIRSLQDQLTKDEDSSYFRQLEADRLRKQLQFALFNAKV